MASEFDPHVALGARARVGDVVAQGIGAYHGRAFATRAFALQTDVARHVDDLAVRLDVRYIAHHDPRLSARGLVQDPDVVQRHLVAMRDLIDALGFDANTGIAGEIVVGK